MPSREELLAEIAREESRLVDLKTEVQTATGRLAGLREQLAALRAGQVGRLARLRQRVGVGGLDGQEAKR